MNVLNLKYSIVFLIVFYPVLILADETANANNTVNPNSTELKATTRSPSAVLTPQSRYASISSSQAKAESGIPSQTTTTVSDNSIVESDNVKQVVAGNVVETENIVQVTTTDAVGMANNYQNQNNAISNNTNVVASTNACMPDKNYTEYYSLEIQYLQNMVDYYKQIQTQHMRSYSPRYITVVVNNTYQQQKDPGYEEFYAMQTQYLTKMITYYQQIQLNRSQQYARYQQYLQRCNTKPL